MKIRRSSSFVVDRRSLDLDRSPFGMQLNGRASKHLSSKPRRSTIGASHGDKHHYHACALLPLRRHQRLDLSFMISRTSRRLRNWTCNPTNRTWSNPAPSRPASLPCEDGWT